VPSPQLQVSLRGGPDPSTRQSEQRLEDSTAMLGTRKMMRADFMLPGIVKQPNSASFWDLLEDLSLWGSLNGMIPAGVQKPSHAKSEENAGLAGWRKISSPKKLRAFNLGAS
jgi:hypothetical protein